MNNGWFLQDLMTAIADQGRSLLPSSLFGEDEEEGLQKLVDLLMSGRGEASGVAIARQLLNHYHVLEDDSQRLAFFRYVGAIFEPESDVIIAAARAYEAEPSERTYAALQAAVESRRQEFFRRLNLAPGGTAEIVRMRADMLRFLKKHPELSVVDRDMVHLLQSWFNRGFLVLRPIDWHTPATILDRIIAYEAVHEIRGWDDLKRRLDPVDRRCFGYFHPSMVDEPLIFVEVALMTEIPDAIGDVIDENRKREGQATPQPTTAVFYSISNCQAGLKGISFGNFLIKHVVEELIREVPSLKTFVTLSPVPGFAAWLDRQLTNSPDFFTDAERDALALLPNDAWHRDAKAIAALTPVLQALAAHYFVTARNDTGNVIDPVARFHLGNGARLERINMLGDPSRKGLREAHGLMVNYLYEPREIEKNHEAFANEGKVAASRTVRSLVKRPNPGQPKPRPGMKLLPAN
ncbi:MAG: malonyl-CoA decarboxylase [Hyphomicrobiaceae bacterium]